MRSARCGVLSALAVAASLGPPAPTARAWTPIAGTRPVWSGPVPYALHEAGSADLGGFAATEAIVRAAMEDWSRVDCTNLAIDYRGSTSDAPFSGVSEPVVGWIESSWVDDPYAIGVTAPSWSGSQIVHAEMALNGVHFAWQSGAGSGSAVDAYSIVLHEAGHYYGIGHTSDASATMYPSYSGGTLALASDDETAICTLYPSEAGGDCSVTGCPTGQSCVGGVCVTDPATGGGAMCDPCSSGSDCGTGAACLNYPAGARCGTACTTAADCERAEDRCELASDGRRYCVRRDEAGAPTCDAPPSGGPPADAGAEAGPPDGAVADAGAPDGEDAGPPGPDAGGGPPPRGSFGEPCDRNEACMSGLCAVDALLDRAYCTALCRADEDCPSGSTCVGAAGPARLCVPDLQSAEPAPTPGCAAAPTVQGGRGGATLALIALGILGARRRPRRAGVGPRSALPPPGGSTR